MPTIHNTGQTCGFIAIVSALMFINLMFFKGYERDRSSIKCTTDDLVLAASEYLIDGATNMSAFIPSQCQQPNIDVTRELQAAAGILIRSCQLEQGKTKKPPIRPILTLFTTHANHKHGPEEKIRVHHNTLYNWATLRPDVNLVLFTNDSFWKGEADKHEWDVLPTSEQSTQHAPVLKRMFHEVMLRYDTTWYGYANADILFLDDLLSSLDAISVQYNLNTIPRKLLITGRRTDVNNVSFTEASSFERLRSAARLRGSLFRIDGEDFFMATKSFPWHSIPPVVVGRPAYDNWLMGHSKCFLNTTVIDVTSTVTAVHQSVNEELDKEWSYPDFSFNGDLLVASFNKTVNYVAGLTSCLDFTTFDSLCGTLRVSIRRKLGTNCRCTA